MANTSVSVKQEPASQHRPPPSEPIVPPAPSAEAIVKSVSELGALSAAIQTFKCRFDELQNHLNFIEKSIEDRFKDLTGSSSSPTRLPVATANPETASIENLAPKNDDSELKQVVHIGNGDASKQQPVQTLEHLCQTMCSRGLRKHLLSGLSDIPKLREEVRAALKFAPNPAKLVFECIGRFFLQGKKAYVKESPMITARQASVLILEFFLLMMGDRAGEEVEIEASTKQEAEAAALSWRKRLITEGGIRRACEVDARGLLLLVAGFGIPAQFRGEDLMDLIILSNARDISEALRQSRVLVQRIPDIMERMLKYKFYVEAADVVFTFGIEDKYPPQTILTSFLRESKEASKKSRRDASFSVLKEAKLKQLDRLKFITKCLEDHKVDTTKLVPGWEVKERMISLEKEIAELDKKISDKAAQKRHMDERESSHRLNSHEMKRSRLTVNGSPQMSQPIIGLHDQRADQRAAVYADSIRSYAGLMATNYLDNGVSSSFPQDGTSLSGVGIGGRSPGLYVGIQRQTLVDDAGQSYMWRRPESAIYYGERSTGRSYAGYLTSVGMNGSSQSLEGFAGVPDHSSTDVASRGLGSELYRFADSVAEGGLHRNSGSQIDESKYPGVPAHLLRYLY